MRDVLGGYIGSCEHGCKEASRKAGVLKISSKVLAEEIQTYGLYLEDEKVA